MEVSIKGKVPSTTGKTPYSVEEYISNSVTKALVKGGYEKFSKPWNNSDVILVVEEHKFHVHRSVLGIYSPVFFAMFNSEGFSEKNKDEIPLPDKKALEFLDLLNQLYVEVEVFPVKMENVEHLLKLADEYQITVVMERCRRMLHAQSLNTDNALIILILGQKYKFEKLRKNCYPVLKTLTLRRLKSRPQYDEMDKESHKQIVTARLEESEKILPDIEALIWTLLENAMKLTSEAGDRQSSVSTVCKKHISCIGHYGGWKAKKLYNSCPDCKSMLDSIFSRRDVKDIIERLKMLGVCTS